MKKWIGYLCVMCFFSACEKNISLALQTQQPVLVVDASIENAKPPVVVLSNSLNYYSTITPADLEASFIHKAVVQITDGTTTATLAEFWQSDSAGNKVYYYSLNNADPASFLLGQLDKTYQLNITTTDGKTYTSSTTIPSIAKKLDSLWWKPAPDNKDTTLCVLWGRFTDPKGLGNYIRYFTSINGQSFLTASNSVFDDQFTDGTSYNLQFNAGYRRNTSSTSANEYGFVHRGDTVTVKFCNIDKAAFTFWNTWEFSLQSTNNPFSAPVKVIGNISNGALGTFTGYAAEYKTIIIPK